MKKQNGFADTKLKNRPASATKIAAFVKGETASDLSALQHYYASINKKKCLRFVLTGWRN